jgi:GPH family glycoside/pentoside/hexuronide:cation symporter
VSAHGAPALTGPQLGAAQRLSYGVGDFAFNLFWTTAGLFLLFYYTDVLGLSPATAGWVFAGALIWDAMFDPLMGYIANRTRTRWGRYRPYLLLGAMPLAASWALIFLPTGLKGGAMILLAVAAHVLFRSLYAAVSMPFVAMSATMTRDSSERGAIAGIRMIAGAVSSLLVAIFTLKLVGMFGGGQQGFFWTAIIYGALATAILFLVFATTIEQDAPADESLPTIREMIGMLRVNRAFWIVSAAMLCGAIGNTFFQKTLPYYFKYTLGREDLISPALAILVGSMTLSIPFWTWWSKRLSKRVMWLSGAGIGLLGSVLLWLLPSAPGTVLPILVLLGASTGSGYLGFWGMLPDTVEYGEWRSGVRAEGAVFGLALLVQKASLGLAAAALGEVLSAIGYHANLTQSPETLAALRTTMIAVPAALTAAAAGAIAFYPVSRQVHDRILTALASR